PNHYGTLIISTYIWTIVLNHFPDNVKLKGIAAQSSVFEYYRADRAVDGIKYAPGAASFCTGTNSEVNPWWRLNLLDNYYISTVTVTNRANCCPERLDGAEIRIVNSLENNGNNNPICAVITSIPAGASYSYSCPDMVGRYVNVVIPQETRFLALCEVEVYGSLPGNVAIGKNATQSPTHLAWEAEKAIDGIKNDRTKCSSTGYGNNSFWRLDLLNIYRVYTVVVTNRIDCCSEHLNGAEIRVGNSLKNNGNDNPKCAVISSIPAGVSYFYLCVGMVGRYVNLVIPGVMKVLTLCEVEVYGTGTTNIN
uniref:Fucolectin tachylectin-4 pentraxin-1 domain-containing protein n=1 Tax=Sinocyclocheilus anshuiensis TaxID=1608454 RepID=A0A671P0E2_9TELE